MTTSAHVAVVTGSSRGIGRAIAVRLAAAGMDVVCVSRTGAPGTARYAGSVQETVDLIRSNGGRALPYALDIGDPEVDLAAVFTAARQAFGAPVDVLVNNAANDRHFDITFDKMTHDFFARTVDVNVWAPWNLALHALAGMKERGAGWILNISSRAAGPRIGPPWQVGPPVFAQCMYGSSKAMLDRLTTSAASELSEWGIAMNALAPEGAVATENAMTVAHVTAAQSEPEETMAEAALALCTGDPRVLTGRVAYSLSLVVALNLPVYTLDGSALLPGWQPDEIPRERLISRYLVGAGDGVEP